MRSIEFRAWHMPSQRLLIVHSFTDTRVYELIEKLNAQPGDVYTEAFRRDDCILMEYTGLVDPSGVKIFEGDVLAVTAPDEPDLYVEVIHQAGGFGTIVLDENKEDAEFVSFSVFNHLNAASNVHCEAVVGNIYQRDLLPIPITEADQAKTEGSQPGDDHKALLAWQNGLDSLAGDPDRASDAHAYQVHFTWLGTLQGIAPTEKNELFTILRDRAKAHGVVWVGSEKTFLAESAARADVLETC